jgi:hypothetical protein
VIFPASVNDWGYKIKITAVGAKSAKKTAVRRLEVLQNLYTSLSRLDDCSASTAVLSSSDISLVRRIDCAIVRFVDVFAKEANKSEGEIRLLEWDDIVQDERAQALLVQHPLVNQAIHDARTISLLQQANSLLQTQGALAYVGSDKDSGLGGDKDEEITIVRASMSVAAADTIFSNDLSSMSMFHALPVSERGMVEMLAEAMNTTVAAACEAYLTAEKDPDQALNLLMAHVEASATALQVPTNEEVDDEAVKTAAAPVTSKRIVRSLAQDSGNSSSRALQSKATNNSALEWRFDFINQLNSDFMECQSIINLSQDEEAFAVGSLLSRWREYLYSRSKSEIFVQALQSSQTAGQAFELTISRSKALRFGARGQTDKEGRWSIFGQIFRAVQGLSPSVLRRSDQLWKVLLAGERAQDAGGPYRESWTLMCAELMSSTLSLFVPCANARNAVGNNRDAWILNPLCTSPIESQMLQFFGKLMGAAVRSQQFMDLTIAPFAWKMIVGLLVGPEDLREIDSLTISTIDGIRNFAGSEAEFAIIYEDVTFTTTSAGGTVEVDLIPRGRRIPLSYSNRLQYCDELLQFRLRELKQVAAQVRAGLSTQLPQAMLTLLTGSDLESLVCGSPDVDVGLLRSVCEYSNYSEGDSIIRWFWELLAEFSVEDRKTFLRFIWGRSRLPLTKAAFTQKMKITRLDR